jgi:hypothetical protein
LLSQQLCHMVLSGSFAYAGWNLEQSKLQLTFYKIIIMSSLLYSPFTHKTLRLKSNCYFAHVSILGCRWLCKWLAFNFLESCCGGAGLIIQEATVFLKDASLRRSRPLEREHIEKLAENKSIYCESKFSSWIQLAHAGRKTSAASPWNGGRKVAAIRGGWDSVAPSGLLIMNQKKHLLH